LLCGNIGSTERDLTSRECKRHQKKNLMDRGNVCVEERKGDFELRTPPLYTYQVQTPTCESSFILRKSSCFVSFCCLHSNTCNHISRFVQPHPTSPNHEICYVHWIYRISLLVVRSLLATYIWKLPWQPSDHPLLTLCSITSKAISSPCVFSIIFSLTFYRS
jgi:hypothetical protein